MASYPSSNDKLYDLWLKIAYNYHSYVSWLTPPRPNDSIYDLQKKVVVYTAEILNN